jgi:hypothetical protein
MLGKIDNVEDSGLIDTAICGGNLGKLSEEFMAWPMSGIAYGQDQQLSWMFLIFHTIISRGRIERDERAFRDDRGMRTASGAGSVFGFAVCERLDMSPSSHGSFFIAQLSLWLFEVHSSKTSAER